MSLSSFSDMYFEKIINSRHFFGKVEFWVAFSLWNWYLDIVVHFQQKTSENVSILLIFKMEPFSVTSSWQQTTRTFFEYNVYQTRNRGLDRIWYSPNFEINILCAHSRFDFRIMRLGHGEDLTTTLHVS